MPVWEYLVLGYWGVMNIVAAVAAFTDKRRSKKGGWRIPEKNLFTLALLGGSLGMFLMMKAIRHKTLHKRFMIGLPLLFLVQCGLFFFLLRQCGAPFVFF